MRSGRSIERILTWYFDRVYGQHEGPGLLPFYCDPQRVGFFAVTPSELSAANDAALFRLFVSLAMYQGLRDVVIMSRQRSLPRPSVHAVTGLTNVSRFVAQHACPAPKTSGAFETLCSPTKVGNKIDCSLCPGSPCHVKDASVAFNRMADMGKLPTSAWLQVWGHAGLAGVMAETLATRGTPRDRADFLVARFAQVHRVGRKLASMFVSALSTPALAPGLTPWFPAIDGNDIVVVDTNVARAVDVLNRSSQGKSYESRVFWIRKVASSIDLSAFRSELPKYSPRVVQQALYAFGSRSNRSHRGDPCSRGSDSCVCVAPGICPFASAQRTQAIEVERPARSRRVGRSA